MKFASKSVLFNTFTPAQNNDLPTLKQLKFIIHTQRQIYTHSHIEHTARDYDSYINLTVINVIRSVCDLFRIICIIGESVFRIKLLNFTQHSSHYHRIFFFSLSRSDFFVSLVTTTAQNDVRTKSNEKKKLIYSGLLMFYFFIFCYFLEFHTSIYCGASLFIFDAPFEIIQKPTKMK